ncbi:unnamed protein product [Ilex paraguariensis]|uniref:Uncharacterized protein n=1 Tax=Ilex paraguariensis TaxID=185542 RepID=A0ABC8SU36_9AQUA
MELPHFSHEHRLIPMEVRKEKGGRVTCCVGCLKPILGAAYSCTVISNTSKRACYFFLHKRCAELPEEIENPLHQHHVLSLRKDKGESIVVSSTAAVTFAHLESAFLVAQTSQM